MFRNEKPLATTVLNLNTLKKLTHFIHYINQYVMCESSKAVNDIHTLMILPPLRVG